MPNFRWPITNTVTGYEQPDGSEQWGVTQSRRPIGTFGSVFGSLGGAPPVPADGEMQPTIGPGAAPMAAPQAPVKMGLPPGGIIGLLRGQSPQGLVGMLQRAMGPQGGVSPLAGGLPQAGMLPGMPGSPMASPVAPPAPQLPMDINPMNQF